MPSPVTDICNRSLSMIGYPRPISDIYEGSAASVAALQHYGKTRDEVLELRMWEFARKTDALASVAGTPPTPWTYQFAFPSDCILARYVFPTTWDMNYPFPQLFTVADGSVKLVLANVSPALIVYTERVTDTTRWDTIFTDLVVERLAKKFVAGLGNPKLLEMAMKPDQNVEVNAAA